MNTIDVIVVDDDFMVAAIHRRFVDETPGFRTVAVAQSVAEAERSIAEHRPQVILLDVYLPDGSGLDLLRRLRADGVPVAVIVITAAHELEAVEAALHGGATDYIVKPFEVAHLRAKLTAIAKRMDLLAGTDASDQSSIDAVFHSQGVSAVPRPPRGGPLPKGLSPETAALVLDRLRQEGEMSAAECADAVGLSRPAARRYLEHFLQARLLTVRHEYGKVGRPERRYRVV